VGEEVQEAFRAWGFACEIVGIDQDNHRTAAFDPELVATLERLGSCYFTGGDQALIVQALIQDGRPTPALEAIRRCWRAGGLIAGSSAGAAIMSDPMIMSGGSVEALVHPPAPESHDTRLCVGPGLGFFPHGLVDQHFLQRGRLGRLVAAMRATGWRHGFGIDENTAMVIADGRLRVLGETGMVLVDASGATGGGTGESLDGLKLSYLDRGDGLDLATLEAFTGPAKRPVRARERWFRAPARARKPAFAARTIHELTTRLVEGDPAAYRRETSFDYDPATGTEIAVDLARGRGARALVEHTDDGPRVTALDFDLRLTLRRASRVEHQRHRALRPLADAPCAGQLVLLGGGLRAGSAVLAELRGLVGPPVGVIATASAEPRRAAAETVALLGRHGIDAIDLGATRGHLRSEAGSRALVERIAGLGSFLITGGNQRRLMDGLLFRGEETPVLKALTDAGLLDQNLLGGHRLGRLIVACAEAAVPLGYGLCEEAGLVVEPDRGMRVIGRRGVVVVEVEPENLRLEDDVFAVHGLRLSLVPPRHAIGADHGTAEADGLTLEQLVSALRREVGATVDLPAARGAIAIRLSEIAPLAARLDVESFRGDR
jgi:cyanophycinase